MVLKSILYICPENPYPTDSGDKIRGVGLIRLLAEQFDIDVLCYASAPRVGGSHIAAIPKGCRIHAIPTGNYKSWRLRLRSLAKRRNNSLLSHADQHFADQLSALSTSKSYEYVVVAHSYLGHLLPMLRRLQPSAVLVTDAQNFETDLSRQFALTQRSWIRMMYFLLASRWNRRLEKRICRQTDLLFATSESDAESFRRLSPKHRGKVYMIPNFVDSRQYEPAVPAEPGIRQKPIIVLPGNMSYFPNVNGALYFNESIYPIVKRFIPDIEWHLVGRDCHPSIVAMAANDPSIVVTGYVPDVGVHVRRASAVIVPLIEGGGTRLKILEAWAYGVPVISTTKGAEGIAYEDGVDICIADEPHAFANAIVKLTEDRTFARGIADRALMKLRKLYDRKAVEQKLLTLFGIDSEVLKDIVSVISSTY